MEDQTVALVKRSGYPVEIHDIYTEDDYQIRLQRIPNNIEGRKESVLLVHGILTNAAQWVLQERQKSLAFLLSDAGFEVWLFNARGTKHSLTHRSLSPESKEFWDFTWSDIAVKDLPAAIDHILLTTRNQTVRLVCHSQGCAAAVALLSELSPFREKVSSLYLLAPGIFVKGMTSLAAQLLPYKDVLNNLAMGTNMFGYVPGNTIESFLIKNLARSPLNETTKELFVKFTGDGEGQTDLDDIVVRWPEYVLDGSSVKQFIHYAQLAESGRFCKFDHKDPMKNYAIYGQITAPAYDFECIKTPIYVFYGTKDALIPAAGSQKLIRLLPNVKKVVALPWNHGDLLYAKHVDVYVNRPIVESMIADRELHDINSE